jgi:thiol:disulfide interchange protein
MLDSMRLLVAAFAAVALLGSAPGSPSSAAPGGSKVQAELVSEVRSVPPGATFWVGLRQRIAPGWHTYWINPGDSGEAATIAWTLPEGFSAGAIVWPHPERIPVGALMSYGYTDEVVLLVPITAPAGLDPGGRVTLGGRASWLVCEKICIPEEASIELTLPVGPGTTDPAGAGLIRRAHRAVPVPSPWAASFSATPESITLRVAAAGFASNRIADVWFYPTRAGVIEHAAPQETRVDADGITLRMKRAPGPEPLGASPEPVRASLDGVLVVTERLDQGTASQAFVVSGPKTTGAAALRSLLPVLALALAGGIILNLMPCVLPVLSVKALSLVQHTDADVAVLRRHGVAYTAGVLASFAVVAAVLLALRAGGEQIGWGFQLQSPFVVTVLAYVLFAMALGLSGVLVISGRLAGAGGALASRPGYAGSFFTGALATVAATPCTAPFMGVAVGFALTQPWATALLVFEALGLGLALPYLALTLVPAWRRFLPRPGPWMETLKQLLAFPLYASVAWLVWVVSRQAGPTGVAVVLAGLVLIALAAWVHAVSRTARGAWRQLGAGLAVTCVAASIALGSVVTGAPPLEPTPARADGGAAWELFSPARLAALRAQGTPVFVNVTAAWCITCLVNERVALRGPAVAEAFARKGVVYLKADWTTRDAEITKVLESFGRSGVPLYVLYAGGGAGQPPAAPTLLPQILTEGTVLDAVERI